MFISIYINTIIIIIAIYENRYRPFFCKIKLGGGAEASLLFSCPNFLIMRQISLLKLFQLSVY